MAAIYLVRHGQASFGSENYDNLSPVGVRQAECVGQHLQQMITPDRIVSGAMMRHKQTAQGLLDKMESSAELAIDAGFNEFDHEALLAIYDARWRDKSALSAFLAEQEHPKRAFQEIFAAAIKRWVGGEHDGDYEETWRQFTGRVYASLEALTATADKSEQIVVYTSGGPIAALCRQLLRLDDRATFEVNYNLANGGITRLLFSQERISLSYLNNYSHLEREDSALVTYR